ncbi:chitin-binding peritrophin-A domain protein, putative (macronuclear) [Tetrahymena thermophila SB210]|uniref:Chitin-binding peritrophin-A domain protein, putative n=1 Tax=Tetrahymena thermophila (strain SB210) TaxID=312017 RepID=Q23HB8_TETTS|nr:chitin-binding peritrophin-A domain protein, putative [Tetrahymena thermophila SB210]EAR95890.2 chitin-binding peritrophin-A domain protein, putative [Tetrahymena thermophila SB210]|eukprot:XP_001016135.2 chitin-binding peritrophin-A domain protein, putative [Tetrahymena thermophila SB210]
MKLNCLLLFQISQLVLIIKSKSILNCKRYQIQQIKSNNDKTLLLCEECDDGYIQSADLLSCLATKHFIDRKLQTTFCLNGQVAAQELCCNYCSNTDPNQCLSCNQACQQVSCPNNLVCASTDVYYQALGQCLFYCGGGKLAYSAASCATSQICQDGLQWSQQNQSCVYSGCQNNFVAMAGQTCNTSQFCQDGYQYQASQKGDEKSQGVCIKLQQLQQQLFRQQSQQQLEISSSDSNQSDDNLFIGLVAFSFVILAMVIFIVVYFLKKFYQNMNTINEKEGYDEVINNEEKQNEQEKNDQANYGQEINIEKGSAQNMIEKEINANIRSGNVQDILFSKENAQKVVLSKEDKNIQTHKLVSLEYPQYSNSIQFSQLSNQNNKNEDIFEHQINIELPQN